MAESFLRHIDALIFDMDGTLWNATASYAKIWNMTCAHFGHESHFTGEQLTQFMGMGIAEIMDCLLGDNIPAPRDEFLQELEVCEDRMMPTLGGCIYKGVKEGLERLKENYRLFMLSNCSYRGLKNFTSFTGTEHLFEGLLSQGERNVSKAENLIYLKSLYGLENPLYVGDTQRDCDQAHQVSVPFAFASYGFGECVDAEITFNDFNEFVKILTL